MKTKLSILFQVVVSIFIVAITILLGPFLNLFLFGLLFESIILVVIVDILLLYFVIKTVKNVYMSIINKDGDEQLV